MKNWTPTETPNFSKMTCASARSFTFHLNRPKVYATRDFPERFGVVASRFDVKECEGVKAPHHLKEDEERDNALEHYLKGKSVKSIDANEVANLKALGHYFSLEAKNKVKETLDLFRELYNALLNEEKVACVGKRRFDVEAADRLRKKGKWINSVKQFGHIPGIAIGDQFHYRAELAVVGLHCQYVSGIDYVDWNGEKFATSIVDSGQYENKARSVDVLIYSGQGGHAGWGNKGNQKLDQKLERGNLALVNSKKKGNPVRVIRKRKRELTYTYDGLYVVNHHWQEKDSGKLVFKFELYRMSAQQRLARKMPMCKESCVVDDVSQGRERVAIHAMNGRDGERPHGFAYTTHLTYPEWCKPACRGCDCTNGCSNSEQCLCVVKNGGEIKILFGEKDVVYECGPSCKCPPSCVNRVSQRGLQYKLEIFKTEESGVWGVRSRSFISSGSFVCEFVGKLEANEGGFAIDARKVGNVGRFIRHSSSPNLFVQRVLYDHQDVRLAHVMLFASKSIRPLQELCCDYSKHKMDGRLKYQVLQL